MGCILNTSKKGGRHYVQSADLFNAIQMAADEMSEIKGAYVSCLSMERFAYHLCELHRNVQKIDNLEKVGSVELTLPDGRVDKFWLCESQIEMLECQPYDESFVKTSATFQQEEVILTAPIHYTTIEAAVALTKELNYRLSLPKQGKWVFGKIILERPLPSSVKNFIRVTRKKHISGRFSINDIVVDNVQIGYLQFIVGTP